VFSRATQEDPSGRTVVVTGASTGLGRASALQLAAAGFQVVAGVRKAADGKALVAESGSDRLTYAIIDLTDERTIEAAAGELTARTGSAGLWGLVNNAGICVSAPLECLSSDDLRRQFETTVVGTLATVRGFLPLLRTARGRVVNITSGLGSLVVPYLGAYAMAQFAKEAMSDALRRELAPSGVGLSVVRPGAIMTPIWGKVSQDASAVLDAAPEPVASLYRDTFLRFVAGNEQGARASKTQPSDVADAVHDALTSSKPKTRYTVGPDAVRGGWVARLLPDRMIDRMFTGVVAGAPAPDQEVRTAA
jgi:NAD(P)-dependent dehydrogenase (short-subunit alcohol dehydrogenase family)